MTSSQLALPGIELEASAQVGADTPQNQSNTVAPQDRGIHDWYRFVLSFPPHLVRHYLQDFGLAGQHCLLDPFCGTGTTLVEARLNRVASVGLEANPLAHLASSVKTSWEIDVEAFLEAAAQVASRTTELLQASGMEDHQVYRGPTEALRTLPADRLKLLLQDSISPAPLHKTLLLLDQIKANAAAPFYNHMLLALANALVTSIGNLRFGPEVGIGQIKQDTPVVACWLAGIRTMAADLQQVQAQAHPEATVHLADARRVSAHVAAQSVDAVITSPPYPNEKDYTRATRLESVVLGLIQDKAELRRLKKGLVRSNTRGVYKEDADDRWIRGHAEIERLAQAIEARRIELGKTSGFERMYGRVTRLYFGGMARHLADLRAVLKPGARLAYVVGDQASYLRVLIRTGQLLADIAQSLGYELVRIDLFRTRFATATREELREEVVILHWPGSDHT